MLKAMRKHFKFLAPALWIVIAVFIIAIFAVWGGGEQLGRGAGPSTVASVGGKKISKDLYFQTLRDKLEALKEQYKDLNRNLIQQLNIPQQVLEEIIQQNLLLQAARAMGIQASDDEIRDRIKTMFQRDGKFIGFEEYKRILNWNRLSTDQFEESLRKEIIMNKLLKVITAGIVVTPEEVWKSYKNNNESAKIEYAVIETDKMEIKKEPEESEVREYFDKNKENYKIPERREGNLVFLNTDGLKKEVKILKSEIEKYYKANLSQFQEPERVRVSRIYLPYENKQKELALAEAKSILEKIRKGEDFAALAKTNSKDKKAIENGDWGLYEWKTLSSQEQKEIERLSEGETSDILELDDGVSILKVTEKKPSFTKPLEEVKDKVQSILQDQKAREMAEQRISDLEKDARKEKTLGAAAKKDGFQIKTTGLLKEGDTFEDVDSSGMISNTLFQLKEKQISSPIFTYRGVGIVELEKVEAPRLANFDEVEDKVKVELAGLRKKEAALEKMKNVSVELKTTALEKLAEKYKLEYKTGEEHKRGQYLSIIGENSKIDELTFSLTLNEGSEPIEFKDGYALIKVLSRKEVSREEFEKNKEKEKENLLEAERNKFLHSYLLKLRKERGVKIRYDLFLKINSDVLSRYGEEEK
jgi:peptidyl-prolyl cis-trans isomerase D